MAGMRTLSGAKLAVDCVTAAILSARGMDMGTIVGCYEPMNGTGPNYETNVPELVLRDEFGAPDLTALGDGGYATTNTYATSERVSLHGPTSLGGDEIEDPLVMVHHVNLAETAVAAAPGRRLDEVVDVGSHRDLAPLAGRTVTRVVNGDSRPEGGAAYVHIHLAPAWRTMTMLP
jgi:hypothetical protein